MVVFLMLPGWAYSEGDKCIRSMETNGYITDEYPANKPIEDRHVVVESNGEREVGSRLLPSSCDD